jgi:hypothetical protein
MASNPSFSHGLIAGGMNDGYVHVWDPAKIANGESDQLIAPVEQHQGDFMQLMSRFGLLMCYTVCDCMLFLRILHEVEAICIVLDRPSAFENLSLYVLDLISGPLTFTLTLMHTIFRNCYSFLPDCFARINCAIET